MTWSRGVLFAVIEFISSLHILNESLAGDQPYLFS